MRAVHENIEGPFAIQEDIALHGMIMGSLTIEPKARAIVHGAVAGRIINEGGRVELFGMADAVTNSTNDAVTIIDPKAQIRGRR